MPENSTKIPRHIAIIPDGNRRWAKEKGLPAMEGHRRGAQNIQKLLESGKDQGVEAMTFWVFSTENWNRSESEVSYLFDIFRDLIKKHRQEFLEKKTRFVHLGRKDRIPQDVSDQLLDLETETKDFDEFKVGLAIDYGGHDEILRASRKLQNSGQEITEDNFSKFLDTAEMPEVDLIIRTSGEQRLSGFMSWQSQYSELCFADVAFPDFDEKELKKAIDEFSRRERRFGGN